MFSDYLEQAAHDIAAEFGKSAVYTPADSSKAPVTVIGIYSSPFQSNQLPTIRRETMMVPAEVGAQTPRFDIVLSDFPYAPKRGDRLTVSGVGSFVVSDIKPDGFGGASLFLEKA